MSVTPRQTVSAQPPAYGRIRLRAAPTLAVYFAIVLVVLASVFAAARSLDRQRDAENSLDAERVALATSSYLSVHVGALRGLQSLFVGTLPSPAEMDVAISTLEMGERGFLRLFIVDTAGRVLRDAQHTEGGEMLIRDGQLVDLEASPFIAQIVRVAAASRSVIVGGASPQSGEAIVFLAMAAYHADTLLGFVGGMVSPRSLDRTLRAVAPATRSSVQVLAGNDTIVSHTRSPASEPPFAVFEHSDTRITTVPLPERAHALQGSWQVVVEHRHRVWAELGLWSVPLAFALLLGMTLQHERRYMRRLADRSQELETLSTELIQANRSKSEFLANVSHELRTPLNAIVGFAELLREGVYGTLSSRQLGPVERIEASSTHLRQLVDQVLDLAKVTAGRIEVQLEPVALRPFVFEVATEIESLVSDRGLALSLAIPSTLPRLRTDTTLLRQVLLNLMSNAVKFTPTGGITVRARLVPAVEGLTVPQKGEQVEGGAANGSPDPSSTWIALQVVDTGVGIDESEQARIFDEFEQVNAGARGDSMERGTGLGLALARRMARVLGGDVTVESRAGEGTTFTVWLPVPEDG